MPKTAVKRGRPVMTKPGPKLRGKNIEHGFKGTYNKGCRCLDCRAANAEAQREYNARRAS